MRFIVRNVVKNIVDGLFPPRCRGCGEAGAYLCGCCKKYISENMKVRKISNDGGVFERVVCLGYRDEILGELVEEAKYESVRGELKELAEMMWCGYLRELGNVVLVPMPTSRKHVRERAMDHMDGVCREIAMFSEGRVQRVRLLARKRDTVQVGASPELRKKQAKEAVEVDEKVLTRFLEDFPEGAKVVLVDDVWTTGASMIEAGKMLRKAGVKNLMAVAITKSRAKRSPAIRHGEVD